MKRLLAEPLLHFLLLGAALFAAYGFLNRAPNAQPGEIIVSAGQIEHLTATFTRFQQRPPNAQELKGLIDQYVREEILSREAVKLGLDKDDSVIRRRLQQKMEFITIDLAIADEPTEAELLEWLAKHPHDFRRDQRVSFRHVYFSPEKHGEQFDRDVARVLDHLRQAPDSVELDALGDSFLLPYEFADTPQSAVNSQFGPNFAGELIGLNIGEWTGPIASGFGMHLVLLTARTDGRLPPLDEVRELVHREVMSEHRLEANRRFLEALLAKYQVKIEWPRVDPVSGDQTVANFP